MSYRCWTDAADPYRLIEAPLKDIDNAVEWGRQFGIHVCINFHRAPGFCINAGLSPEPWNLWTDDRALDIFAFHWAHFANRYKGIPSANLSFNLLNEPNGCTISQYAKVVRRGVEAIRAKDPNRLVAIDGTFGEVMEPVPSLAGVPNAVHCTRGYAPFALSHYLAPWEGCAHLAHDGWRSGHLGPGPAGTVLYSAVAGDAVAGRPDVRRGVGLLEPHSARRCPGVDAGLSGPVEAGGLGVGAVVLPGIVRHPG